MAKFLRTTLRASDVVARLGGDEFCILLVDDGTSTEIDVERVTALVRSGPPQGERPFALSMSVGVAWLEPGSGASVEHLMSRADNAMYKDKRYQHRLARGPVVDAADHRDDAADQRDRTADHERSEAALGAGITPDALTRSSLARRTAASDRRAASEDRRSGASERTEAERDRASARADRESGASERTEAERDRISALADREGQLD